VHPQLLLLLHQRQHAMKQQGWLFVMTAAMGFSVAA
jgi:hypothetical protein